MQNAVLEYHRAGNYTKGLQVAQDLLKATQAHFGKDHPATAAAYNNTGLLHKHLGDYVQARADYQAAQRIYKGSALGVDHTSYATALHNLGNLNRNQIHLDPTLQATDRLLLLQDALDYLQRAHAIRLAEFGAQHPHTVSSRSAWGATLAVQILHQHKLTETAATETNLERRRFYVSLLPSALTETAWEAAAEHLQAALATAVQHPRGTTVAQALEQRRNEHQNKISESLERAARESLLPTLSAAAAAQNLAVFYKTRATTTTTTTTRTTTTTTTNTNTNTSTNITTNTPTPTTNTPNTTNTTPNSTPNTNRNAAEWFQQAKELYEQVLPVQAVLLHETHPDRYATKHSLAELLQAMGEPDAADALRRDMVDTYDAAAAETNKRPPSDDNDIALGEHGSSNRRDETAEEASQQESTNATGKG